MRIAMGADLLDGNPCGMRIALEGLLHGMQSLGKADDVELIHACQFENSQFEQFSDTILRRSSKPGSGLYWSQYSVPRAVKAINADLLHWPYQILPPMQLSIPKVISVWDLAPMNYPDPSWSKLAVLIKYQTVLYRALKSSDRIITHCRAIADELIGRFDLPAKNIEVIYPGLSEPFKKESTVVTESNPEGPIVYVGTCHQRKNVELLIRSYALLLKSGISNRLALRISHPAEQVTQLKTLITQLEIPGEMVSWIEPCDRHDLINLYRSAALFAFPSLYEGFGLPLIEASACGLPVVALNRSAMPEVVGETGILVDEATPEAFAQSIQSALDIGRDNPEEIARSAKLQAAKFNWDNAAKQTFELYESLIPNSRSVARTRSEV